MDTDEEGDAAQGRVIDRHSLICVQPWFSFRPAQRSSFSLRGGPAKTMSEAV